VIIAKLGVALYETAHGSRDMELCIHCWSRWPEKSDETRVTPGQVRVCTGESWFQCDVAVP